jgi:hypothetical protein
MKRSTYEYRHYNHAVGLSVVHLIWIPKRRKKVLFGKIRDRIFEIFLSWQVRRIGISAHWKLHRIIFIYLSRFTQLMRYSRL